MANRCNALKLQAPASEGRPLRNLAKISVRSKGGFKGDDLRRALNGYLTYVYFGLVPDPVLEVFILIEVSQTVFVVLVYACLAFNDRSVLLCFVGRLREDGRATSTQTPAVRLRHARMGSAVSRSTRWLQRVCTLHCVLS